MRQVKLGRIYKRKMIMVAESAYPEYIIMTSICDRMDNQYRYRFFDVKKGKDSAFIMRQSIIEQIYKLVGSRDAG